MGAIQQALISVGGAVPTAYATFDPARKGANMTLSSANRIATNSSGGGAWSSALCLNGKSTGKWYVEFTPTFNPSNAGLIGIANASAGLADIIGRDANGWSYYSGGTRYNNNAPTAYGSTWTTGDVISIAWDATAGKLYFAKNGVWQNSGDPAAGTGAAYTGLSGTMYCGCSNYANGENTYANNSIYTPPSGFSQWT